MPGANLHVDGGAEQILKKADEAGSLAAGAADQISANHSPRRNVYVHGLATLELKAYHVVPHLDKPLVRDQDLLHAIVKRVVEVFRELALAMR